MEVSQTTAASSTPTSSLPGVGTSAEETRNTFLRLLVAQMEHQDPLKPMENTEFTAQLAQFSVLEQIETMNANFSTLLGTQEATSRMQAVALIGKTVEAVGDTTTVQDGAASPLRYTLSADSAQVTVHIANMAGEVIRTIPVGQQGVGMHTLAWDGLDALGNALPEGSYHFAVSAADALGNAMDVETLTQGTVEGVEYVENRARVVVGGSRIDLSALRSVQAMPGEEGS